MAVFSIPWSRNRSSIFSPGRQIRDTKILGHVDDLPAVIERLTKQGDRPQRLIVTRPSAELDGAGMRRLVDLAQPYGFAIARLPALTEFRDAVADGRLKLQPVAVTDLLGRPQFSQAGSGGSSGSDPDNGGGSSGGSGGRGSHGAHGGGGGTLLYDAVFLASDELMKKQQGRKAIVVLTDGVDRGSKETLRDAIETAQRADTLVYSILFADKEGYGNGGGYGGGHMGGMGGGGMGGGGHRRYPQESRPDGKKVLQQLSKETGGRFFEVTKKETIDQIYAEIDEELRNQYALGYTPDKTDATVGYHKIQLTTKQKDATVQTREGFYVDH